MKKAGKPIVLALANGRPLGLSKVEPLCDAIVEMWQPGVPGGKPLAGVLSGRVNPSDVSKRQHGYVRAKWPGNGGTIGESKAWISKLE